MFKLVLIYSILTNIISWVQIDKNFYSQTISQNNWQLYQECNCFSNNNCQKSFQIGSCNSAVNNLQYINLFKDNEKLFKLYNFSTYETQIIFDVFFYNATYQSDEHEKFTVFHNSTSRYQSNITLYNNYYQASDLDQQSNNLCNGGSQDYPFNISTIVSTSTLQVSEFFITFCFNAKKGFAEIRNVLIYIKPCHPSCKTCNGPSLTNCQSCFGGSPTNGMCQCSANNYFFLQNFGCKQECNRTNEIADQGICIFDQRVESQDSYFNEQNIQSNVYPRYWPFNFIADQFYQKNIDLIYSQCNSNDFVGQFNYNDGIFYQMTENYGVVSIRLRITLYLFNLNTNSKLDFFIDKIRVSTVYKTTTDYLFNGLTMIFIENQNCDSKQYDLIRVELISRVYSGVPKIIIQSKFQQLSEAWGFRNFTIDTILCTENCLICKDFTTCQQCQPNFILYSGKYCVEQCPIYSSNCIDYSEITSYSRYLAKGFYDMNMTFDEVQSYFDSSSNPLTKTGQKFSFFPNKFVLGGLMVWNGGIYTKSWQINKPHYAVTIRFNFTFGDEFSGNFIYKINGASSASQTKSGTTGQNLLGRSKQEITKFYYEYLNPFKTSTLTIEFQCTGGDSDYRKNFCAISEYFIVVHYCLPFCSQCSNNLTCETWDTGYTGSNCPANQYLQFNSLTEIYSCQNCNQIGCSTCNSNELCTSCIFTLINQFYLLNGQCFCYPFYYLSGSNCLKCSKYCESCDGPLNTNCITCVLDHKRGIQFNKCLCLPGYYDDGINIQCSPLCGDQIVVEEEDCDDGNNNPFDGCYQCKFSCDFSCQVCLNGKCYLCLDGFQLYENKCKPICNNDLFIYFEECKDNNIVPFDGCFECKYSSIEHCIDSQFGLCQTCDQINGWYLVEQNMCQPICGDKIIAQNYEQCDDGNDDPNDGCDFCLLSCKSNCQNCINGICTKCKTGFQLQRKTQNCTPICGDKLIQQPQEQCDDGNVIEYDGCYNCQKSCQNVCTNCSIYGCQECNIQGWQINQIKKQCEPICGDGLIIINYEECDDLLNDNCQNCKLKCQDSCQLCYQGNCYLCQIGWELNTFEKICYYKSGDYMLVYQEECDDYNNIFYDGCYKSKFQCQQECQNCQFGKCKLCNNGYYINNDKCIEINDDNLIVGREQCDDQNFDAQDGCYQNQYDCPQWCTNCVKGQCLECKKLIGYQLKSEINQCISFCGDGILAQNEQCDDSNDISYDGCFQCKYQCDFNCVKCVLGKCQKCQQGYILNKKQNICQSTCGDQIKSDDEQCDDGNRIANDGCSDCKYQCHEKCVLCVNGECLQCEGNGWVLDQVRMTCYPYCGDGLVVGPEECDGGTLQNVTGCRNCKYSCQDECLRCSSGQCYQCQQGWYLDYDICIPFCGDKITIGDEECDDGNISPFDGCFDCKYQCQEECTDCKQGICYECNTKGWKINNHICYVYCGDSYVVKDYEECDDGNLIQYDGCYNCKFQCEQLCTSCENGICYECDNIGWTIKNSTCEAFCGDGLIYGQEQCDDMNFNPNDGCNNCKFQCDQYCILCKDGLCLQCEIGRFTEHNACVSYCGDGYYVGENEKCDDGNKYNGDGCDSNCNIENGYFCNNIEGSYSQCYNTGLPTFNLTLVPTKKLSEQQVTVQFSQKMKLAPKKKEKNLNNIILTKLMNSKSQDYQITSSYDNQLEDDIANDLSITYNIEFFYPIVSPIFYISFINDPFVSEYNLTLREKEKTILLINPIVMSEQEKLIVNNAQIFNQVLIYTLVAIASLCLISGSTELFWNLMDQLQYLSYIKYTNIVFPSNLNAFFEVFNLITISPLVQYLKFDQILNSLGGNLDYNIETQNKFQEDQINGYFYSNFQSFLFCIFTSYSFYFLFKILSTLLNSTIFSIIISKNLIIGNKLLILKKELKFQIEDFHYNKVLRILMSNCYDVVFAASIQLFNLNISNTVFLVNSIASVIVYIGFLGVAIYFYGIVWQFSHKTTLTDIKQYEALFEGVSQKNKNWTLQYNSILLIHKQLFISIIVFMQKQGEIQTIFIAINQSIFCCYLYLSKPLSNINEYYKIIITETITVLSTITFLAYAFRIELKISPDLASFLGWIHIASFTSILIISLALDFVQQMKIICQMIKQKFFENPDQSSNEIDLFY